MANTAKKYRAGASANEVVASNVKAELARIGTNQGELARALGENDMWISRRLSGRPAFSTDEVAAIADILEVEVGELFVERRGSGLGRRPLRLVGQDPVERDDDEGTTRNTPESLAEVIDISTRRAS